MNSVPVEVAQRDGHLAGVDRDGPENWYVHRLAAAVSVMAVAAGGLDALVFTGGAGEHAPAIRAAAAE